MGRVTIKAIGESAIDSFYRTVAIYLSKIFSDKVGEESKDAVRHNSELKTLIDAYAKNIASDIVSALQDIMDVLKSNSMAEESYVFEAKKVSLQNIKGTFKGYVKMYLMATWDGVEGMKDKEFNAIVAKVYDKFCAGPNYEALMKGLKEVSDEVKKEIKNDNH